MFITYKDGKETNALAILNFRVDLPVIFCIFKIFKFNYMLQFSTRFCKPTDSNNDRTEEQ